MIILSSTANLFKTILPTPSNSRPIWWTKTALSIIAILSVAYIAYQNHSRKGHFFPPRRPQVSASQRIYSYMQAIGKQFSKIPEDMSPTSFFPHPNHIIQYIKAELGKSNPPIYNLIIETSITNNRDPNTLYFSCTESSNHSKEDIYTFSCSYRLC